MKKTAIIFSLSLVFVVFHAGNLMAQDAGATAGQTEQAGSPICDCGCGMPGCACGPGGCGMRGKGAGPMGMRGAGGCGHGGRGMGMMGMGPGMGMGMGMGPGGGAGVYGKAGLDATKDARRELHMKKFEYFEALRNSNISDEEILKLEEEMRILKIKIRRKAMQ